MTIIFKIADDQGLLLLDLKDLRSMVQYVGDNAAQFKTAYGNVSAQSVGAIQRALLRLEEQGGDVFFGEPALDIRDWLAVADDGRSYINLLHCVELFQTPLLYSTFLLWMLSELYDLLPEAGDPEKPKIVFFFDEAHLIFKDAPKSLLDKVEQIVRLIRSKGVGIYFITQQPSDIPDTVLSQLGNKLQHALRAYTPKDQKGLKAAAQAFRVNPGFDAAKVLPELGTGEVLVSLLDADGVPTMVERAYVMPPRSYLGVADDTLRNQLIASSPLYSKYAEAVDRESAYENFERQRPSRMRKQQLGHRKKRRCRKSCAAAARLLKKEPPTVAEKLISKTMTRMENKAVDTIVRGIFNQMKKWF